MHLKGQIKSFPIMTTASRSRSLGRLIASSLLISSCTAHIQMTYPPPIDSPYNPFVDTATADYSYTSPLFASGANFPCKGYQINATVQTVAEYAAGSTYNATLAGTATHGGGSCQFSLSYDDGATFKVIKSIIGGCPLQSSYNFTIPAEAPSGNVLLAWSWMNLEGNREYYMDCAWVAIDGTNTTTKRAEALADLPNIYVANLASINDCTTVEQVTPVWPPQDLGPDVEYGGGLNASSPITGESECTWPQGSSSNSSSSSPVGTSMGAHSTAAVATTKVATTTAASTPGVFAEGAGTSDTAAPTTTAAPVVSAAGSGGNDTTTTIDVTLACSTETDVTVTITPSCIQEPDVIVTVTASPVTVTSHSSALPNTSSSSGMLTRVSTIPIPSSAPLSPSSTTPPTQPSGTGTTPPYATDTTLFLPCVPGSFLCSSATDFLTCDQAYINGAYGWTWLYPRTVAEGMECEPLLVGGVGSGQQAGAPAGMHRSDEYVRAGS